MNTVILDGGRANYRISEERMEYEAGQLCDLMMEVQAEQSGFILRVEK
ncbi:hypothetical protein [Paenibacillus sp. FSL R5-0519]